MFITLIGHGTLRRPRRQVQPARSGHGRRRSSTRCWASCRRKQIVFVNTSSASGPFVAELSGPGRTIVTATRNGAETYATLFGGFFVDALTSEAADCGQEQARQRARGVPVRQGGGGARLRARRAARDRARAARRQRRQGRHPGSVADRARTARWPPCCRSASPATTALPSDPKLRALHLERRDLERRVEALRLLKDSMEPATLHVRARDSW